jgi:hypothetical protein
LESCVIFYLADTLIKQHNFPTLSLSLTINSLFFCGRHHSLSSAVVRATMGRGGGAGGALPRSGLLSAHLDLNRRGGGGKCQFKENYRQGFSHGVLCVTARGR